LNGYPIFYGIFFGYISNGYPIFYGIFFGYISKFIEKKSRVFSELQVFSVRIMGWECILYVSDEAAEGDVFVSSPVAAVAPEVRRQQASRQSVEHAPDQ
jgi:hypothetical protein